MPQLTYALPTGLWQLLQEHSQRTQQPVALYRQQGSGGLLRCRSPHAVSGVDGDGPRRSTHDACEKHNDVATASLIENWIDETERRTWFLSETISGS